MIFVAVCQFSDVLPLKQDHQLGANKAWSENVKEDARLSIDRRQQMLRWLADNAEDGFRPWVEIVRRDPSPGQYQRITGVAGYRFNDPDMGTCFEQKFGMSAPPSSE
jgi:hypothetical protein